MGAKQRKALDAIAAAAGRRDFWEQVEYNGRRLAKLNVPPGAVMRALKGYGRPLPANAALALNRAYYQVREEEARAFFDLFRAEVESRSLEELLQRFGRILARTFRAQAAKLDLEARDARRRFILAGAGERYLREAAWRGRYRSYWSIPLRPAGVIQLAFATRYEWLPRELELLDVAAERCRAAAEKARLPAHLSQVEEEERRRIGRELHDEAGQSLMLARLQLEMLERTAPAAWEGKAKLAETRQVVERTILEIRRILAALSPAVLEQLGLAAAVRQLTARFREMCAARITLRVALRRRPAPEVETVCYRLLQECYHNIARHSGASHVKVSLRLTDCSLGLKVEDDGVGFDLERAMAQRHSFGLAGMRERVSLMGGSFEIRSAPGQGTAIAVRLPAKA